MKGAVEDAQVFCACVLLQSVYCRVRFYHLGTHDLAAVLVVLCIIWQCFLNCRELCLAALNAHIDGMPDCPKPLCCLDAFSATGWPFIPTE